MFSFLFSIPSLIIDSLICFFIAYKRWVDTVMELPIIIQSLLTGNGQLSLPFFFFFYQVEIIFQYIILPSRGLNFLWLCCAVTPQLLEVSCQPDSHWIAVCNQPTLSPHRSLFSHEYAERSRCLYSSAGTSLQFKHRPLMLTLCFQYLWPDYLFMQGLSLLGCGYVVFFKTFDCGPCWSGHVQKCYCCLKALGNDSCLEM